MNIYIYITRKPHQKKEKKKVSATFELKKKANQLNLARKKNPKG